MQLPSSDMGLVVGQDMEQSLILLVTPLVPLVSVAVVDGTIEQEAVETGWMDESPACKVHEVSARHKVLAGTPL